MTLQLKFLEQENMYGNVKPTWQFNYKKKKPRVLCVINRVALQI